MYEPKQMNKLLLECFPELKASFLEETSWQDGIDTGSYVVYEDVFMPYVIKSFEMNDEEAINRIISFIEELASSEDFEIRNLITVTVIDNVRMHGIEKKFIALMGPCSKRIYNA